jgi:methyltransferase (TIGR00027 family)
MNTIVFELDASVTLKAKEKQLTERGITKPANNVYIPINFNTDDVKTKLLENGFSKNKKSIFILEGLTMYLNIESIDKTFQLMYELSAPGSRIVFDGIHASVLRQENKFYGEKKIYRKIMNGHEQWTFAIEEGQVEPFLTARKFRLIEYLDHKTIEKRFFSNDKPEAIIRVNGTHFMVTAER